MKSKYPCTLFIIISFGLIYNAQAYLTKRENGKLKHKLRNFLFPERKACIDPTMCRSKWGYCGHGDDYCRENCQDGPCIGHIINHENFVCSFNNLDNDTRRQRFDGLKQSGWNPKNSDEAAVFLAHVYHETDGLTTLTEYCAPGCGSNYNQSWCDIQSAPGKLYYGRGWFQISYPCNYNAAGKALSLDLLNNPDLVSQQQDVAVKTAIWFYQANKMDGPAQKGDFAATTRIINGKVECDGGTGVINQKTRVETYKRIRICFGLGQPKINPSC